MQQYIQGTSVDTVDVDRNGWQQQRMTNGLVEQKY